MTPNARLAFVLLLLAIGTLTRAEGASRTTVHQFAGSADGAFPQGGVISDAQGNLYGTTEFGGANWCRSPYSIPGCGTVFELSPPSQQGGSWIETILHSFNFNRGDGAFPTSSLIRDEHGNLYGTTQVGGRGSCVTYFGEMGCGSVFELSPPFRPGEPWSEKVLYSFQGGNDGYEPYAGLVLDAAGNLYGTTVNGGANACGCGTVFEIVRPADAGDWSEHLLYSFNDGPPNFQDGQFPYAPLVFDAEGNLYGTTSSGGTDRICGDQYYYVCGTVFELSPPTSQDGSWTETILYTFDTYGQGPMGGLIFDQQGNLYGTTALGPGFGGNFLGGVVFELSPPSQPGGPWTEKTLYALNDNADDPGSYAALTFDTSGNLLGTSVAWPLSGEGTVFRLNKPNHAIGDWTATSLGFGGQPNAPLIWGFGGALYSTTPLGGGVNGKCNSVNFYGCGTVFSIKP